MKLINKISTFSVLALMMTAPMAGVMAQTPDSATQKTRQRLAIKSVEQQKDSKDTSAKTPPAEDTPANTAPAETDTLRATGKKGTEVTEESTATTDADDLVPSKSTSVLLPTASCRLLPSLGPDSSSKNSCEAKYGEKTHHLLEALQFVAGHNYLITRDEIGHVRRFAFIDSANVDRNWF